VAEDVDLLQESKNGSGQSFDGGDAADPGPLLRLTITPAPTPEERDAIVAAIAVLAAGAPASPERDDAGRSRWVEAGRRAASAGRVKGSRLGWGRPATGWSMR
jgi:hypothetical protein